MKEPTHAYVVHRSCGHPVEVIVDLPDEPPLTAGMVANAIIRGSYVQRVSIDDARKLELRFCDCSIDLAVERAWRKRQR
jgi:hypothetical protein